MSSHDIRPCRPPSRRLARDARPSSRTRRSATPAVARSTPCLGLARPATGWLDIAALVRQVLLIARRDLRRHAIACRAPGRALADGGPVGDGRLLSGTDGRRDASGSPPRTGRRRLRHAGRRRRRRPRAGRRSGRPIATPTRSLTNQLPADPFWKAAHRDFLRYRGEPQRQAARAAVLNDGGSLIVALPTGRGKTAVAWSKVLLSKNGCHHRGRADRRARTRHGAPDPGGGAANSAAN